MHQEVAMFVTCRGVTRNFICCNEDELISGREDKIHNTASLRGKCALCPLGRRVRMRGGAGAASEWRLPGNVWMCLGLRVERDHEVSMRGPPERNHGDVRAWATDKLLHAGINTVCHHHIMPG